MLLLTYLSDVLELFDAQDKSRAPREKAKKLWTLREKKETANVGGNIGGNAS